MKDMEIERKFLIRRPEESFLESLGGERLELSQTYLRREADGASRRVREIRRGEERRWYYTEKLRLSDLSRVEREREISREDYVRLLKEADPQRRPIEKTRFRIPYEGHILEIDLFPFWQRQAFCEAELESEEEELRLPPWLELVRELSADRRYTNAALAREIPGEEI